MIQMTHCYICIACPFHSLVSNNFQCVKHFFVVKRFVFFSAAFHTRVPKKEERKSFSTGICKGSVKPNVVRFVRNFRFAPVLYTHSLFIKIVRIQLQFNQNQNKYIEKERKESHSSCVYIQN